LFGLTNVLVMFGGSKDGGLNQEISDLVGQTRVSRTNWQTGTVAGRTLRSSARKRSAGWRNDAPW
jgi:type IV secretion system protein VirD4